MKLDNFFSRVTLKKRYIIPVLLVVILSLRTTGTFTWTSIDQRVINETRHEGAPGGRLHDDFEGLDHIMSRGRGRGRVNKDIYVENYSSRNILARVRLSEYLEIGEGAGTEGPLNQASPPSDAGLDSATLSDKSSWAIVRPDGNLSDGTTPSTLRNYVGLYLGDDNSRPKIFMPTFNRNNQNQESNTTGQGLELLTGTFNTNLGIAMPGTHDQWTLGQTHTSTLRSWNEVSNTEVLTPNVTHTAQETVESENGGYMTMSQWIAADRPTGNFWVHDTDGWIYWANWLPKATATSLLLDALDIKFDTENTYYGMHAEAELATVEDLDNWVGMTSLARDLLERIT